VVASDLRTLNLRNLFLRHRIITISQACARWVIPTRKKCAKSAIALTALVLAVVLAGAQYSLTQDQTPASSDQSQSAPDQSSQDQSTQDQTGQDQPDQAPADAAPYAKMSREQLDRIVAPIALYPDALVAQILSAATFPSQIADAQDFVTAHPGLSAADLGKQVDQQQWDPSVKALVQYPSVLSNLSKNLGWTSELGDAYYNQHDDVMKAVQEMRKKAQKAGNLKSTDQLKVEDKDGDVDIDPVNPEVVYVPAYDPWIVYGYPIAPWPYWVDVPGIWWGGPGLYFGIGFPIAPFFGFGWGWGAWGVNWYSHGIYFNHAPYFAHGPAFFDRGGYYGGRAGFGRPGEYRGGFGDRGGFRGYDAPRGGEGTRSGAFSGIGHGGMSRGFSARGQSSFAGGFHGGGFGGGGFHGGGGGRR
jgi:uncharacterized membrane protein YgcG